MLLQWALPLLEQKLNLLSKQCYCCFRWLFSLQSRCKMVIKLDFPVCRYVCSISVCYHGMIEAFKWMYPLITSKKGIFKKFILHCLLALHRSKSNQFLNLLQRRANALKCRLSNLFTVAKSPSKSWT